MFILFCLELSSPTTKRSPTIFSWSFTSVTKVTWAPKCHVFQIKTFQSSKISKTNAWGSLPQEKTDKKPTFLLSLWDEVGSARYSYFGTSCNCHNVSSWPWRRIYMDHPLWSLQVLGLTTWPHSDTMKPSTAFHIPLQKEFHPVLPLLFHPQTTSGSRLSPWHRLSARLRPPSRAPRACHNCVLLWPSMSHTTISFSTEGPKPHSLASLRAWQYTTTMQNHKSWNKVHKHPQAHSRTYHYTTWAIEF